MLPHVCLGLPGLLGSMIGGSVEGSGSGSVKVSSCAMVICVVTDRWIGIVLLISASEINKGEGSA